jgi:hypothetical protein
MKGLVIVYCAYDTDMGRIVAYHDSQSVVETYVQNVVKSHPEIEPLKIIKVKRKEVRRLDDYESLYLVRCGETYVQSGYIEYLNLSSSQFIYDERYARDVMLRVLEMGQISEAKKVKRLKKAIKIMDELLYDSESYTPSLKELKTMEMDLLPYMNNRTAFDVR